TIWKWGVLVHDVTVRISSRGSKTPSRRSAACWRDETAASSSCRSGPTRRTSLPHLRSARAAMNDPVVRHLRLACIGEGTHACSTARADRRIFTGADARTGPERRPHAALGAALAGMDHAITPDPGHT